MNLGFDSKRLFLNRSGLGNYSRWLVKGLCDNYPQNQYHLYTTALSDVKHDFTGENIHHHLPANLFKTFWRTKGIKKDLLHDKIKVYHGLSNELPMGIEKTGIKSVVTIHDLIFKIHPEYYNPIDRQIYDLKFKSSCVRADKVVAISEHTKQIIIEHYGIESEKIEVIYLDASKDFLEKPVHEEVENVKRKFGLHKPYFLNVGAIGGRKNQFRLLEAFADISEKIEHDLVLAGKPGKETGSLLLLINKYSLTDRVKYLPNVTDSDLINLYHGSYATVYPSLYEGFGIPILESYRCGKPVLTSYGSSLEEIAGSAGLFCNPQDASDISRGLLQLTDSKVYKSLQNQISKELPRFESRNSFEKYMQIYQAF
jgi:glycosyltransferase involved in cell wall biosynthesis